MRRLVLRATPAIIFSAVLSAILITAIWASRTGAPETVSAAVDPNEVWAITLIVDRVPSGPKEGSVLFGANKNCSDGFKVTDSQCDEARSTFLEPELEVYFYDPLETADAGTGFDSKILLKSIKVPASSMAWWLRIENGDNTPVTVTLTPSGVGASTPTEIAGRDAELFEGTVSGGTISAGTFLADLRTSGAFNLAFTAGQIRDFVITVAEPAPLPSGPTLTSPVSGDLGNDNTPLFTWGVGSGDFDSYRLQVTSGSSFTAPFDINTGGITQTQFQTVEALPDATYMWQVRTQTGGQAASEYSDPFIFTVDTVAPTAPANLISPIGGVSTSDNAPLFQWTASSSGDIFSYRLQVTSGSTVASPFVINELITGDPPVHEFRAAATLADATYSWRVIAGDRALNTASSGTETFEVDIVAPAAPANLISPAGGISTSDNTPLFQWAPSTSDDIFGYRVQVTSGSAFASPFDIDIVMTGSPPANQLQVTQTLADDTYMWRVIAGDRALNTASSATATFTVDTVAPAAPVLVSPQTGALLNTRIVLFKWNLSATSGDVANYILQVTTGGSFDPNLVINKPLGPSVTGDQNTLPADGAYLWRVVAKDSALNTGASVVSSFVVDTVAPTAPTTLISPAGGVSTSDNTPLFLWAASSSSADIFSYRLQVTSGGSFTSPIDLDVVVTGGPPANQFQATAILLDATYMWRVIARDRALNTASSGTETFTVDTVPPGAAALDSPANNVSISDNRPLFEWTAPSGTTVVSYRLQVVTSGGSFTTPFDINVLLTGSPPVTQYLATVDLSDDIYKWRVIATESSQNTGTSLTSTFTIDTILPAAPVLVSPQTGDFLNTRTVLFQWNLSATSGDVANYILQVTTGGTFNPNLVINKLLGSAVTGDQNTLPLDGVYLWRVVARDRAQNTGASGAQSFTVDTVAPTAPALVFPQTGDFLNTRTVLFRWNLSSSGDVKNYILQVTTGGASFNANLVINKLLGSSVTGDQNTVPADGLYLWRVIAKDFALNTGASQHRSFTADTVAPTAPGQVFPQTNALLNTRNVLFEWNLSSSTDVEKYILQVTTGGSGSFNANPFINKELGSSVTGDQHTLPVDGVYLWRVIAQDFAQNSGASQAQSFRVDTVPPGVSVLISPAAGEFTNDNTPLFQWVAADGSPVAYRLQVVKSANSFAAPFVINSGGITQTQLQLTGALADDTYKWRVIASDAAQNSSISASRVFTVDTVDPEPPTQFVSPPALTSDNTPLFEWYHFGYPSAYTGDAVSYRLQVTSASTFTSPFNLDVELTGDPPATQFQATAILPDATYMWRVVAGDRALNTASSATRTFRIDTTTNSPVLNTPINDLIIGTRKPTFTWSHSDPSTPVSYRLLVTSDSVNGSFSLTVPNITGPSFTPTTDFPVGPGGTGDYFWQVRATDSLGNFADSVAERFIIDTNQPPPPAIISPADKTSGVSRLPTFKWGGVALADIYDLEIATGDFNTTTPFITVSGIPHSGSSQSAAQSYPLTTLLDPGTLYVWRVRGRTNSGITGDFSAQARFITTGDPVDSILKVVPGGYRRHRWHRAVRCPSLRP